MSNWFDADKDGLRQIGERLVERRGFGIIGAELYQNVMDTNATICKIELQKTDLRRQYELVCEDNDPLGFPNLAHAYTVFAPSLKKDDPEKGGRFNIGEKFVLAFCRKAEIATTKGTVIFNENGRDEYPRRKRELGTRFSGIIDCTQERFDQFLVHMQRILVRRNLLLTVNGVHVPERQSIATFEETLLTEQGDDLRPTKRKCVVEIYEPAVGEAASLYELGIPVVETGDKWHYSVKQKVPLNVDRDNVTPAYLRDVRVVVFNHMHHHVTAEDTEESWVDEATSDSKVTDKALADWKDKKHGKDAVAKDPFNRDANGAALADGRPLIEPHATTKGQRKNLKERGMLASSTQAYPLAGKGAYSDDPGDLPIEMIDEADWTEGMRAVHEYTVGVAQRILGKPITVRFVHWTKQDGAHWRACYGTGLLLGLPELQYNVGVLGKRWFANGVTEDMDSLIIHELGHDFCTNHADENYFRALTKLGARLKAAALAEPEWFRRFQRS